MTFDWGYLVVLGVVAVMLVVFRQLDKNNRSLEKIRKFAENVRHELNTFVDERTASIKDFETILKVHDKTAQEILRRIQGVETGLLGRIPEIEDMQSRLDRYALSMRDLDAMTARVETNFKKLEEETIFVDKIGLRIKGASDQMSALEAAFVQIRQEFADINRKDLETVRKNALEVFERETFAYVEQIKTANAKVDEFQATMDNLEATRDALVLKAGQDLEAKARQTLDDTEATYQKTADEAESLSLQVFRELEVRIQGLAALSEANLRGQLDTLGRNFEGGVADLNQVLLATRNDADALRSDTSTELEGLRSQLDRTSQDLRAEFQSEQGQLMAMTAQLKGDLEAKMLGVRRETVVEADKMRQELLASLELSQQSAKDYLAEVSKNEQRMADTLDSRLKDYEAGFAYRYQKMEESEKDLLVLDSNLRQAMERIAERIGQDFQAFDERMNLRRVEEQATLEKNLETTRGSLERLDKELEELKSRAFDNVSEKLAGFEEEFFADLQKRNAQLHHSLEEWQGGLKVQLEDAREQASRGMEDAQRNFAESARVKTQDLQATTWAQLDRLERQIHESQEAAVNQIRGHHTELDDTRARLKDELAELEKSLSARYQQEINRAELEATEAVTRLERETESRLRQVGENLDQFRADTQELLDGTTTEFSTGQAKFTQRFKDLEAEVGELYRGYKTTLSEKISALTEEFTQQKEELVTRSAEDRASLRSELSGLRAGIDELDNTLRLKTQAASEAFEREYESSMQDFQKKNRDLLLDMENKLRDYRSAVQDTREKAEAMQKKLFGKVEDQANLLAVSLEEIEKKQKSFVNQTKVFERADSLKQDLQEAIEDLKGDLARIEVQRKDLFEVESSITRVKKLGDETSEKMARFATEKKRIDLMDSDFQRILALSQSMEVRLEQVTSSNDLLQDIQLKIRKLEDYSKDIEIRYERLEKRREVLDNTTDGVDRNFALLEKVEKSIKNLDADVRQMPGEVEELRKRLKVLGAGKEDADKAVERLIQLDQLLKDVEGRIGRMEEARDWIARTETRLIETKDAAEAQIGTFQTLAKANSPVGTSAKSKGVDNDLRQTVIKLARQGWGKEEISRATKLSLGEVELILELGPR